MKKTRYSIKTIGLATLIGAILAPKLILSADAPARPAMNAIIEGAKKEGRVSWGCYLYEYEVGRFTKQV